MEKDIDGHTFDHRLKSSWNHSSIVGNLFAENHSSIVEKSEILRKYDHRAKSSGKSFAKSSAADEFGGEFDTARKEITTRNSES